MFDGLSGMDWLFMVAALALGFGVVRFMLVYKSGEESGSPLVMREEEPGRAASAVKPGEGGKASDGAAGGVGDGLNERAPAVWFEVLGVARTASSDEIEQAFARQSSRLGPERAERLMTDLSFIADGSLARALPKQLEMRSMKAAMLALQLRVAMGGLMNDMESARDEGLMRRRQGLMD